MKDSNHEHSSIIKRIETINEKGEVVVKYITYYADLLAAAHEAGIKSLVTEAVQLPSEANGHSAVVKAVIETGRGSFCALGDASPENVEAEFLPHVIRVAETRAKARALRDALNIGVVAFEEISGRIGSEHAPTNDAEKPAQTKPAPAQASDKPRAATPSNEFWSDNQRRLIFRLLSKRGLEGEALQRHLRESFNVSDLRHVKRKAASDYIDKLMSDNGTGRTEAAHA